MRPILNSAQPPNPLEGAARLLEELLQLLAKLRTASSPRLTGAVLRRIERDVRHALVLIHQELGRKAVHRDDVWQLIEKVIASIVRILSTILFWYHPSHILWTLGEPSSSCGSQRGLSKKTSRIKWAFPLTTFP